MIIKTTEKLLPLALYAEQTPAKSVENTEPSAVEPLVMDEATAAMLLSILGANQGDAVGGFKAQDNTASVKFMITNHEEQELRQLGYGQEQIDRLKPQEAADILKATAQEAADRVLKTTAKIDEMA